MPELVLKFLVVDRKICSFLPLYRVTRNGHTCCCHFLNYYICSVYRYPEYDILGDPNVAKTAAVSTRYSDTSLNGIILDIHFLSLCDYLVCTFSSQVCNVS
jgi:hypothetical protein